MSTAVQPYGWAKALPRPQYAQLKKLNIEDDWFEFYQLYDDIIALYEPGNFQEVISYLVLGQRRCLLLDTGMGIGDMKKAVEKLTDKEIIVVNTHSHFDHIGCNWQFEEGYIFDCPPAHYRMENGLTHESIIANISGDSTIKEFPKGFDPEKYEIKPATHWHFFEDGHKFDLGDKVLTAYNVPGHSPDSIALEYTDKKIVFTGDTYYPATLYAHIKYADGMNSEFDLYQNTMHKLADKYADYTVIASHNEPLRPGIELVKVAEAFDLIKEGKKEFMVDEAGLKKYEFETFAIVTN